MSAGEPRAARVLVVLPSWVGDTTMATPSLRLLREALPGAVVLALGRPGMDELLAGSDLVDDVMTADARSLLGPAKVAARLKPARADAALLLPNSFSTAMTVRLAGIPIRVGYDRDGRGMLLTHALPAPRRTVPPWASPGWEPIPAVEYYLRAALRLVGVLADAGFRVEATARDRAAALAPRLAEPLGPTGRGLAMTGTRPELSMTDAQERAASAMLADAGVRPGEPFALINPGGNNPDKRWPVERFAAVTHHLITARGLRVLLNGSPPEAPLVRIIRDAVALNHPDDAQRLACLPDLGITLGTLKGVVARARLMITNDTGPRHIAAAFATPCITLFGPTDPRWTTLPDAGDGTPSPRERVLVADPTLPPELVADEHPDRCRIDRIDTARVIAAADELLAVTGRA